MCVDPNGREKKKIYKVNAMSLENAVYPCVYNGDDKLVRNTNFGMPSALCKLCIRSVSCLCGDTICHVFHREFTVNLEGTPAF